MTENEKELKKKKMSTRLERNPSWLVSEISLERDGILIKQQRVCMCVPSVVTYILKTLK